MNKKLGPIMMDAVGKVLTQEEKEILTHPLIGGFIVFGRNYDNPAQLKDFCDSIRQIRPDLLLAVDYEGGRVQRFREGFTRLPPMKTIGKNYATQPERAKLFAKQAGILIGTELAEFDFDLPFAPVLDRELGMSGVIGDRAFSENTQIISELSAAFMAGLHSVGLSSTGKHFPGHGAVIPDSHQELPVDYRDLATISKSCLIPFEYLIQHGMKSVMMAHILFPQIDEKLPASLSPIWIKNILQTKYQYKNAIFCDDLSMGGAAAFGDYVTRAKLALDAGCDMLPVCNTPSAVIEIIDNLSHKYINAESDLKLQNLRNKLPRISREVYQKNSVWQTAQRDILGLIA